MGLCCQKEQQDINLDPLEQPLAMELERPTYSSAFSSKIHSDDLWGNYPEEVVDNQIYEIQHTWDADMKQMDITLLEKNDLVNIAILINPYTYLDTAVEIEGWEHILEGKKLKDFESAPETFRFEDRNWILKLGWESYNESESEEEKNHLTDENGI